MATNKRTMALAELSKKDSDIDLLWEMILFVGSG